MKPLPPWFATSPLGKVPPMVNAPLMRRVPEQFRRIVMLRANKYFEAGCHQDLCETASCRDIAAQLAL
jgi:hypothetical protein